MCSHWLPYGEKAFFEIANKENRMMLLFVTGIYFQKCDKMLTKWKILTKNYYLRRFSENVQK